MINNVGGAVTETPTAHQDDDDSSFELSLPEFDFNDGSNYSAESCAGSLGNKGLCWLRFIVFLSEKKIV